MGGLVEMKAMGETTKGKRVTLSKKRKAYANAFLGKGSVLRERHPK